MLKLLSTLIIVLLLNACAHNNPDYKSVDRHYVVVNADIADIKKYDEFIALEIPILKNHGAFIEMDIRNKDQSKRRIIVSFPSKESVDNFVKSEEFQKILPMNKESAKSSIFHGSLYR